MPPRTKEGKPSISWFFLFLRSYLIQRNFQAELGLDFGWAMVSWFASGMMFGRATLLRDACNNLYYHDLKVIDYIQYEGEKKDFSPYSTARPRAFGFRILVFLFFSMDCINLIFQPKKRRIISFGSSILTVIIMPILPQNLFRWSRGPPFSVDEIRMKGILSQRFFSLACSSKFHFGLR